jgi:hypothetical protein
VRDLPFVGLALPALRLCSAVALAVLELERSRAQLGRAGAALALAGVLAVSAVCDVGLALASRARPLHAAAGADRRVDYDVKRLSDAGVILVGDSFVWGQGVARAERFGDRLEELWRAQGVERPVYSFGAVGANVRHYARMLAAIPEKPRTGRIVLSFYVNDLPPAARLAERAREQLIALGTGAPTLRVLGDAAALALAPDLERFNQLVVEDYDPRDPTFAARWKILEGDLGSFAELAKARSVLPPLLLILPLMVDFERYPLTAAHGRLRALGERLGFQVLDMLPTFRARLRDGSKHLAAPDDNHFDAATHELVARTLLQTL